MAKIDNKGEMPNTLEQGTDEMYMRRCIQLALNAEGRTYPNPMVGAVIVCDGKIIGEGWHHKAGEPHAEVNAVRSVADPDKLKNSTIYVSLEPCAHFGRTPPCADLIIEKQIPRVVIGCRDSFAKVDGRGIMKLREAGRDVKIGVMEDECRWLNRRFFTNNEKGRPYIILKWAHTSDGFMGRIVNGKPAPAKISNDEALLISHKQRTTEDAILIGIGTALSDNPSLTARLWDGPSPLRIVIDPDCAIHPDSKLLTDGGKTLIVNNKKEGIDGNVKYVMATQSNMAESAVMAAKAEGVTSIIVEGGAHTLAQFIENGLWDEAYVYESDSVMGDGVEAPILQGGELIEARHMGDCTLRRFKSPDVLKVKYFDKK